MITREQFALWKHEPATKWFFEFLQEKQKFLMDAAVQQWIGGNAWPEAVRGQIIELDEIAQIQHEAIVSFYKEQDGTESEGVEAQR